MAFTAADVVTNARDLHPAFDPKTAPNEVAFRFLQRFARSLAADVIQRRPEALTRTALVTALPLATFANGVTLPAHLIVDEVTALRAGGVSPVDDVGVELVHPGQRGRSPTVATSGLTAYLVGSVLQLQGTAVTWSPFASVTVRYVPVPTVTTGAATLPFPDSALGACTLALADFFGQRRQGMSDAPPSNLWARQAADQRDEFLALIMRQGGMEAVGVQDAYGDNGGWS